MIVRTTPAAWILISQVQHARISAEIATVWQLPESLESLRNEVLAAVEHHDDGWHHWEQAPTINDHAGPRDFMEMTMPVATGIWTASIDVAARTAPWSGLWVSHHFCALAELALEHRDDGVDRIAAQAFIKEQEAQQRQWRAEVNEPNVTAIERAGLHALQFFDRVSLWLCTAERTAEQTFSDASGQSTVWTPESATTIRISGGGFTADELSLSVAAMAIEQRRYADDSDLRGAITQGRRAEVHWVLRGD